MSRGGKQLPAGWGVKTLGDVCNINYGTRVVRKKDGGSIYDVYGGGGKTFFMDTYNREDKMVIARFAMSEQCTRFVPGKFFLNDSGLTVDPKNENEIFQKYLDYYFISKNDLIYSLARGSAQKNLNVKEFRSFWIPVPPLSEQKRIVAILDEAFADIAKAKANAEQNLINAKQLFESYLQGVLTSTSLSNHSTGSPTKRDGWEIKKLGEVYDVRDGTHDSPKYHNQGFPLITSKNLKNHKLIFDDIKFISEMDYININKRSKVDVGDVLFAMIGTIGNPVVIENEPNYAIKNVALFKVRNEQNSYFLKYFLDSKETIEKMMRDAKGTTQKFVGLGYLRSFPIPLPSIKEQQAIVQKLDALRAETQKLEAVYQKKIDALDELKKSLLQKAFSGELSYNS